MGSIHRSETKWNKNIVWYNLTLKMIKLFLINIKFGCLVMKTFCPLRKTSPGSCCTYFLSSCKAPSWEEDSLLATGPKHHYTCQIAINYNLFFQHYLVYISLFGSKKIGSNNYLRETILVGKIKCLMTTQTTTLYSGWELLYTTLIWMYV